MKYFEISTRTPDEGKIKNYNYLLECYSMTEAILKLNEELQGVEFEIFSGSTKNYKGVFENAEGEKFFKAKIEIDPVDGRPFKEWYVIQSKNAENAYKEIIELLDLDMNFRVVSMIEHNIEEVIK